MNDFIQNNIKEHQDTYDPNEIRDLIDLYIQTEKVPNSKGNMLRNMIEQRNNIL